MPAGSPAQPGGTRLRVGEEDPVGADPHEDLGARGGEVDRQRDWVVAGVEHEQRHRPTVTRRLSNAEAARYQEWIANDRRLRRTVEQMREVAEQAREIILAAEQAGGSAR